jgi:hypothetical protein
VSDVGAGPLGDVVAAHFDEAGMARGDEPSGDDVAGYDDDGYLFDDDVEPAGLPQTARTAEQDLVRAYFDGDVETEQREDGYSDEEIDAALDFAGVGDDYTEGWSTDDVDRSVEPAAGSLIDFPVSKVVCRRKSSRTACRRPASLWRISSARTCRTTRRRVWRTRGGISRR